MLKVSNFLEKTCGQQDSRSHWREIRSNHVDKRNRRSATNVKTLTRKRPGIVHPQETEEAKSWMRSVLKLILASLMEADIETTSKS